MIMMCKKLKQPKNYLMPARHIQKNKRIALQNEFVFTTEEKLQITKEAESISATKNIQKQP